MTAASIRVGLSTRVGLFLTNQHPIGSDVVSLQEDMLRLVRHARDHGWDSVFTGQHLLPDGMAMLQPVPFLGRIIPESGDMRIGIAILLLALHNPVEVAETFASLDVLSGGRITFGAGLGYRDVEYAAMGVPRRERVRRLEENLDIVIRLWSGETVSVSLPWCELDGARLSLLPHQRPRPPIWMAANRDEAVARAARLADTWVINPHATTETISRQLDLFRDEAARAGRPPPPELPTIREIFCAPSREEALHRAGPHLAHKYRTYSSWGQDRVMPEPEDFSRPLAELRQDRFIIGTPDDCLRELTRWRDDLGVDHFVLRTHWSGMPAEVALASMQLLSDEVIPALRRGRQHDG